MAGANIKIGASSSEFQKQMKEVTNQLKLVSSECGIATEKAKLFGDSQEKLTSIQKELTAKMQAQSQMINLYKDRIAGINSEMEKEKVKQTELSKKIEETTKKYKESVEATGKSSDESKKLQEEIKKLKEEYAKAERVIESNGSQLLNVTTKMNNTEKAILQNKKALDETEKSLKNIKLDNFTNSMDKVSSKTGTLAGKLAPLSLGIAGAGVASGKMAMDFETSMAKVFTIADGTVVSYDDMKRAIIDLSNQTGISSAEIANNVYDAISAGQQTGDAVNFVSSSTKLAKAGFAEAGQALDLLTTIMNGYKLKAEDVNRVSDILITTQNLGKVTVGELSESMGKIIKTADVSAVSLEQVSAGYALITSNGIKSAESTTYMSSMLNELTKSGTKASTELKNATGKTFQDLMKDGKSLGNVLNTLDEYAKQNGKSMQDMFGSAEAAKAALILADNSGQDFNKMLEGMNNSLGATQKAFDMMNATTGEKMKIAFNKGANAMKGLGDILLPMAALIFDALSKVTDVFNGLSDGQKKFIVGTGAFVVGTTASLKGISMLTGSLRDGIKAFKDIKDFGGKAGEVIKTFGGHIGSGAKAVGGFAKDVAIATKNLVVMGAKAAWTGIQFLALKIQTAALTIATKVQTIAQAALNFVMSLNPITLVIAGIVLLVGTFIILYNKCEWFRDGVSKVWETIKGVFQAFDNYLTEIFKINWTESFGAFGEILNAFSKNASNIWESIKRVFSGVVDFIGGVFSGDWSRAWSGIVDIFGGIMDGLGAVIKAPLNVVIGLINMAIDGLNSISFTAPSWVPIAGGKNFGVNLPKINYLYEGGIINSPTFISPNTVAGDAYKGFGRQAEAVIPLDGMYRNLRNIVREEQTQQPVYVIVNVDNKMDSKSIGKLVTTEVEKNITRGVNSYRRGKGDLSYAT